MGKYIYGICNCPCAREVPAPPIGGADGGVHMVVHADIAAIVSDSPVIKYTISRENILAHQAVLEAAMRDFTVLPVRFSTIAEDEGKVLDKVLRSRYGEFITTLEFMKDKTEMGLKVSWGNLDSIYAELMDRHPRLKMMKQRLHHTRDTMKIASLGEMVKDALDAQKARERDEILRSFEPLAVKHKVNRTFGDAMVGNLAFLVAREKEPSFDEKVRFLEAGSAGRYALKFVGGAPAFNFIEIVISWD